MPKNEKVVPVLVPDLEVVHGRENERIRVGLEVVPKAEVVPDHDLVTEEVVKAVMVTEEDIKEIEDIKFEKVIFNLYLLSTRKLDISNNIYLHYH